MMASKKRIQFASAAYGLSGLFIAAHVGKHDTEQAVRERIVGIEIDGSAEGGLGGGPFPVKPELHKA